MKSYRDGKVISNIEISPNIYKIVLEGDFQGKAGQFYMLRAWEGLDPYLSRPISISDLENRNITFLYEVRGKGTRIISKLRKGDNLSLLGPLGNGLDTEIDGKVAIIAGGIGIAPMYYLLKTIPVKGDLYAGFRSDVYIIDELKDYTNNIYISTEDGSQGHKGYIVDVFEPEKYDLVITCGPTPMMKAVIDKCKDIVPVYISMENHMGCGIGTCLSCTTNTIRGMERVCKEGPVFSSEEVILDE